MEGFSGQVVSAAVAGIYSNPSPQMSEVLLILRRCCKSPFPVLGRDAWTLAFWHGS